MRGGLPAARDEEDGDGGKGPAAFLGSDGLIAARDAPIGGQAVLEGVMMRGVANWAVAVRVGARDDRGGKNAEGRQGDRTIEVSCFTLEAGPLAQKALRLPLIRGVAALWGSLAIGLKALGISANAQLREQERGAATLSADGRQRNSDGEAPRGEAGQITGAVWAGTLLVGLAFAIALFFLLPLGLSSLLRWRHEDSVLFWLIEGLLRIAIFLGYLLVISGIRDLRGLFEYHGAEHKTISCFEAGVPLLPENAQRFSRLHPRCGTSFLLVVMLVSILVFGAVGTQAWYLLVLSRILLLPLIVGVSFEVVKLAGRHRKRAWVRAVMWPGLKLQLLTTREPDLQELEVAIAALKAVLEHEDLHRLSLDDLVGVEVVA